MQLNWGFKFHIWFVQVSGSVGPWISRQPDTDCPGHLRLWKTLFMVRLAFIAVCRFRWKESTENASS